MYVNFALKATPVQDITVANTCATCFFFIATNTRKKSFTAPIVYAIATRATAMLIAMRNYWPKGYINVSYSPNPPGPPVRAISILTLKRDMKMESMSLISSARSALFKVKNLWQKVQIV